MSKTRYIIVSFGMLLALATAWSVHAQDVAREAGDPAFEEPISTAPVTLDGEVLFRVRGVSALPAPERAARIAANVRKVARDLSFDPEGLIVLDQEASAHVMAGDVRVLTVVNADARLEGVERGELAQVVVERIREAIKKYRRDRQPEALVLGGLHALAATAALLLLIVGLMWLRRVVDGWLAARLERRLQKLGVESLQAGTVRRAGTLLLGVLRAVRLVVMLALAFVYLQFVLGLFPWTRPFHARVASWFVNPLRVIGEGILEAIPDLIFLAVLFFLLRWTAGLIRMFFEAVERGAVKIHDFDPEWARPTFKIARLLVILLGVVVAYPYIPGSGSAAFKGVSIFAGIVFSLGSSSAISNLIAGFAMTYRRAFRIGDRVRVGDVTGEVADIRLQVTHIRTAKNEEVVVPNSMILNGEVTNYTTLAKSHGLILHTTVGIGYETPWRQVEAMLLLAAERVPDLLREPPPFVLEKALGDFCITYELNVYCDQPRSMPRFYSELHRAILDVFNEFGVQIMTPAYEGDPGEPKVVPREQWFTAPAAAPPGDPRLESGD